MPILVFTSPNLVQGRLEYALARLPYNQFILIYGRSYGMAATRVKAILNYTTPHSERIELSGDNHPLIWLDSDVERGDQNPLMLPPGSTLLEALLAANPPVIKTTGRTKMMYSPKGGKREASEVEVLLSEDDLTRICYYCRLMETVSDDRLEQCGGQGHESLYSCRTCLKKPAIGRVAASAWNNFEKFVQSYSRS